MRFEIVIDRTLVRRIDYGGSPPGPVRLADDVVAACRDILAAGAPDPAGLVVFAPGSRLRRVVDFLSRLSARSALAHLVILDPASGKRTAPPDTGRLAAEYRKGAVSRAEFRFIVTRSLEAFRLGFRTKNRERALRLALKDTDHDQDDLINIGRALSTEKDIDVLFRMILERSMKITGADAGTIYILEAGGDNGTQMRVKYSETFSRAIDFEESVIPLSPATICGYVALTGMVLNIPDVTRLGADSPVTYNPRYDREHNYRTKSMLVVPMRNHSGAVIGVIQLINSKENLPAVSRLRRHPEDIVLAAPEDYDRFVVPFAKRYDRLLEAVAAQAAIAIENARMVERINHQFEEFVKASVSAIESRDASTSGHSFRVAALCLALADAVNRRTAGPFREEQFDGDRRRELQYAALLHDYGKVYMDMRVFRKAKKLYPEDLAGLMQKIEIAFRQAEINALLEEKELLLRTEEDRRPALERLEKDRRDRRRSIELARERIRALNEPSVSRENPAVILEETARVLETFACADLDGEPVVLLDDRERTSLLITRGSLTEEERREIESHVRHTYDFVSRIPWPPELARIPALALAHHEMLDGSGYPNRLRGRENIPLGARMMAIADIFDALTAKDRPYKKAVPLEKALAIMTAECESGRLDPDLFALFREERLWETVSPAP